METAFFEETVAFLKEVVVFLLGLEEAFKTVLFFAAPDLLEEEAGFNFIATVFFFKAFFLNVFDDALRTDFFLAMQSPFYEIIEEYNQDNKKVSLKKNDKIFFLFEQGNQKRIATTAHLNNGYQGKGNFKERRRF